tara:strand:+ start:4785 stop:4991 length:207 start_codon:yes stop_codon:yes gene_type:complete
MKRYLVKQTMILYQEIIANSKEEAIEQSKDYIQGDFGDVQISGGSHEDELFLMESKYSAEILDKQIKD